MKHKHSPNNTNQTAAMTNNGAAVKATDCEIKSNQTSIHYTLNLQPNNQAVKFTTFHVKTSTFP